MTPARKSTPPPAKIKLRNGGFVLVDAEDYDWLAQYRWFRHSEGYASRMEPAGPNHQRCILMHREIAGTPAGMVTDHINRNRLDNRRSNLRICTWAENRKNSSQNERKSA